jgi:hypothetical protein
MGYRLSPAVWNASRLIYPRWCRSGFPHSQRATLRERSGNYRQRQKAQWPEIPRPRRVGRIASMGRFFINGCRTTGRLACPTPMRAPSCQECSSSMKLMSLRSASSPMSRASCRLPPGLHRRLAVTIAGWKPLPAVACQIIPLRPRSVAPSRPSRDQEPIQTIARAK